ncbi:MAG: hypothetical protein WCX93_12380 [Burkholderiaceae bacterium]
MLAKRIAKLALAGLTIAALTGCATHHDRRTSNTMMGAGLGATAGAVVSQGDPWYALGGAAAGGLLGNILTEDDKRRSRHWDNDRRSRHHVKDRDRHRAPERRSGRRR